MMTSYEFKEALQNLRKPKEPIHIFKEYRNKIVVY